MMNEIETPCLSRFGVEPDVQGKVIVDKGIAEVLEEAAAAEPHAVLGTVDDQLARSLQGIALDIAHIRVEFDGMANAFDSKYAINMIGIIEPLRHTNDLQGRRGVFLDAEEILRSQVPGELGIGIEVRDVQDPDGGRVDSELAAGELTVGE